MKELSTVILTASHLRDKVRQQEILDIAMPRFGLLLRSLLESETEDVSVELTRDV